MLDTSIGYFFLHYYSKTLDCSSVIIPLSTQTLLIRLLNSYKDNPLKKNNSNKNFLSISRQPYFVKTFIYKGKFKKLVINEHLALNAGLKNKTTKDIL